LARASDSRPISRISFLSPPILLTPRILKVCFLFCGLFGLQVGCGAGLSFCAFLCVGFLLFSVQRFALSLYLSLHPFLQSENVRSRPPLSEIEFFVYVSLGPRRSPAALRRYVPSRVKPAHLDVGGPKMLAHETPIYEAHILLTFRCFHRLALFGKVSRRCFLAVL